VGLAGPGGLDPDASALSAIASRGGFTERAWKAHVLVVRGSLDHPVAFTVDIAKALTGTSPNLALEPGDLVYVAEPARGSGRRSSLTAPPRRSWSRPSSPGRGSTSGPPLHLHTH
jgi:hypothetical protein